MDTLKTYKEFITELNHQRPDTLGVNEPGYGQGAHYGGDWGINYGKQGGSVRNTFGDKGDGDTTHIPTLKDNDPHVKNMYYNPITNEYLSQNELKELVRNYQMWCRQNNEEPIELNNLDSKTIGWIYQKINN